MTLLWLWQARTRSGHNRAAIFSDSPSYARRRHTVLLSTVPSGEETMLMRRVSSKDRIPKGLLGCAVVSGLAAAATLGGVGTANATCLSVSGINSIRFGMHEQPAQLRVGARPQQGSDRRRTLHRRHCDRHGQRRDRRGIPYRCPRNRPRDSTTQPVAPQAEAESAGALSLAYAGGNIVRTRRHWATSLSPRRKAMTVSHLRAEHPLILATSPSASVTAPRVLVGRELGGASPILLPISTSV